MKTLWKQGDIITSQKINNIILKSQNKIFFCLNDYQDENDETIFNISFSLVKNLALKGVIFYYYKFFNNDKNILIYSNILHNIKFQTNSFKIFSNNNSSITFFTVTNDDTKITTQAPISE